MRRWIWWAAGGFILIVLLSAGAYRLYREIPERLRIAEKSIHEEAARYGLKVSFKNLKFHILYPHVSLEDLEVLDERAGTSLLRAGNVDVSISPGRMLTGDSPISRIRIRKFRLEAGEKNRPVFDRLRKGERKGGQDPEILLLDGEAHVGPIGPLIRWDAKIKEARIREVRFLGTRIFLQVEEARGEIAHEDLGTASWPIASIEAELFVQEGVLRMKKFRASGPAVSMKVSGEMDMSRRSGEMKLSGAADVAKWISGNFPGSPWVRGIAEKGNLDFSIALSGSLEDPSGSGKISVRDGMLAGKIPLEADLSATVSKRKLRVENLKGKIWGGSLAGAGVYDLDSRKGEGKISLTRVSFGETWWKEQELGWRPVGTGDAEIVLSAAREKWSGRLSARNPGGIDRMKEGKRIGGTRLPLSAVAEAEYVSGGKMRIASARITVGAAFISGSGDVDSDERRVRLKGAISIPQGRSAEYGWDYPVSWGSLAGEYEVAGAVSKPHVIMRLQARDFQARDLPPVPVVVKLDGDPTDLIFFVADIPAAVAKVTATGSVTGPLSRDPLFLETAVAFREIDFSEGNRWIAGILSSLGKDPEKAKRHLAGLAGSGHADLQLSAGGNGWTINGALRSAELRVKDTAIRDLSLNGGYNRSEGKENWKGRADGKIGEGDLHLEGSGKDGTAEISGTMDGMDLAQAFALASNRKIPGITGTASVRFSARVTGEGWVLDRATASVPRMSIDNTALEKVSAEGSLGSSSGRIALKAQSPSIRIVADVKRGGDWPSSVTIHGEGVPTTFLVSIAGLRNLSSAGKWNIEADGTISAAELVSDRVSMADAISALRFSATGALPSVSEMAFKELRAVGKKEGDAIAGEIHSIGPDTRLLYSLSLKEPHVFRLEGPFSFGTAEERKGADEARFFLSGDAEIAGALRAIERTSGSLKIRQFQFAKGGMSFYGKDIAAAFSADGVRWSGGSITAAGNPLNISGKVSWKGDIDARLDGKIPAGAIRLATDVFDRLEGMMRLDVRVSGKWNNPSVVGSGRLEGGMFSFRGYAQIFEEMQVDAVISREKIVFEHFEGRSGGGYIDGRGEIPLRFDAGQRIFFTADFFDMRYPYPDDLRPVVQGHVELLGPYNDFLVTGDVEVQSARYTKTIRLEKALLDFRKRLADVTARREKSDFRVRLDISAVADGTIKIKNNLADADAKGEFKVVGDASRVIILGAFDVIEGYVEYQGSKYDIRRLTVEFQDPRRNNPRIDARAETRKGNVTVIVSVTGTLSKYEVDLASDPPLSKNDIVSLLSLGVTTRALAGSEGAVGAGVAGSVVLGPYKGKVEEGIRGIVKLDKFAIEPSFSSSTKSFEPKFIVGKSFGDKLSVSVSTNVGTTAESSATAEYKLLENVYLQGGWESATSTEQGDVGADLKFRYRYRTFRDFLSVRD